MPIYSFELQYFENGAESVDSVNTRRASPERTWSNYQLSNILKRYLRNTVHCRDMLELSRTLWIVVGKSRDIIQAVEKSGSNIFSPRIEKSFWNFIFVKKSKISKIKKKMLKNHDFWLKMSNIFDFRLFNIFDFFKVFFSDFFF